MPFSRDRPDAYTCSPPIRPQAPIPYEHMFPPTPPSKLAQRALGALRITRSFLLLEDDHDVDWEVDQDEYRPVSHPHRAPLRRGSTRRRPGQLPALTHACVSPVDRVPGASQAVQPRRRKVRTGGERVSGRS
jgi:hypothetical protein